jgi:hypothetical protein
MTRDEFLALPPAVGLRVLFDALDEDTARVIASLDKIKLPLPPKYDQMIFRQGGVMWASETDIEGLRFWHRKSTDGQGDPKWAEQNKKRADSLARWIAWRECFPDAVWSGERDRAAVVAKAPSSKPMVYARSGNGQRQAPPPPPPPEDIDPDSEIPF